MIIRIKPEGATQQPGRGKGPTDHGLVAMSLHTFSGVEIFPLLELFQVRGRRHVWVTYYAMVLCWYVAIYLYCWGTGAVCCLHLCTKWQFRVSILFWSLWDGCWKFHQLCTLLFFWDMSILKWCDNTSSSRGVNRRNNHPNLCSGHPSSRSITHLDVIPCDPCTGEITSLIWPENTSASSTRSWWK